MYLLGGALPLQVPQKTLTQNPCFQQQETLEHGDYVYKMFVLEQLIRPQRKLTK